MKKRWVSFMILSLLMMAMSTLTSCGKKTYDMSGISFNDASFVYDGEVHSIEIEGTLPEGVTVTYLKNNKINARIYEVIASIKENNKKYNPIEDLKANMTIVKKDLSNIKMNDKTVTYDGKEQSIEIEGKLPEGVTVTYLNNNQVNAGVYEVVASLTDTTGNYMVKESLTASLTIEKKVIDNISFNNKTVPYNGEAHFIEIEGELPEGVTVSYDINGIIRAGSYEVTASFTDTTGNYIVPLDMKATLDIVMDGTYHEVCFIADDKEVYFCAVEHGKTIEDIPAVPYKEYYDGKWLFDFDTVILQDTLIYCEYVVSVDVAEAVENLYMDYTVKYKDPNTNEEYSVFVEDTPDCDEVYYYSEKSQKGYYFDKNDDAYSIYFDRKNKPTYNSNSKINKDLAREILSLINIKESFISAEWQLQFVDNGYVYNSKDAKVIASCVFLNDGIGDQFVYSVSVGIDIKGKLTNFTTYDQNGNIIVSSNITRIGVTGAFEEYPVLNNEIDSLLFNKWIITSIDEGALFGEVNNIFEINNEGILMTNLNDTSNEQYSFSSLTKDGAFIFLNSEHKKIEVTINDSDLFIKLYDNENNKIGEGKASTYSKFNFFNAVNNLDYVVEKIIPDDFGYSYVTEYNALEAYYIYDKGNQTDIVVVIQFENVEQLIENYFNGDRNLYNLNCYLGNAYDNFLAVYSPLGSSIMYNITNQLNKNYVEPDSSKYIEVKDNCSSLEYLIEAMESLGYTIYNKDNPGEYVHNISMIMNDTSCVDVYFFEIKEEYFTQYGCIVVYEENKIYWGENGFSNVDIYGGYSSAICDLLGILFTWGYAQTI